MAAITSTNFLETLPRPTKTYHSATYDRISTRHGFDGNGKTVLITGGSMGIGLSIAKAFANAGVARIALISRSPAAQNTAKAELEAAYPATTILTYQATVTDDGRFAAILDELAAVDVLVLNAAVCHPRLPATALSTEQIQQAYDINAVAALNLGRLYLGARMDAVRSKTIIHLTSAVAQMRAPLRSAYGSSKAAAVQAMRHLALEHAAAVAAAAVEEPPADTDAERKPGQKPGPCPARVFSFHPGAIYTPGTAEVFPKGGIPWEDVNLPAHFALWLAGPESDFLSGRYMWANWDVDELIALKETVAQNEQFLTLGLIL
ncbi:hypothetical protein E4U55_005716 [Claviceps digitariae]|nr:hypothetical protein E4U55_005716 [Claviceps digitariae]